MLRRIAGSGLRLLLWKRKANSLYFGGGAFLENEDLESEPDEEAVRGNFYMAYNNMSKETMSVASTVYYQPSFSGSDFRLRFNASLGFPIRAGFKFVVEFKVAHDSEPPEGVSLTDTTYLTGLSLAY